MSDKESKKPATGSSDHGHEVKTSYGLRSLDYLLGWQREFLDRYLALRPRKALLVTAPGMGKSVTSVIAARELLEGGHCDSVIHLSDVLGLRDQLTVEARRQGVNIAAGEFSRDGAALTLQGLKSKHRLKTLRNLAQSQRLLLVVDDPRSTMRAEALVEELMEMNQGSRALFLSRNSRAPTFDGYTYSFSFGDFVHSQAKPRVVLPGSPSFELIRRLIQGGKTFEDLTWREFEKLIAELLKADGYEIKLMRGTKDGGVDVIASKDLGILGDFKSLWQAKKYSKNKVGLSTIRELADTRAEHKANKGILVTSTFLTRGALERIDRENFLLGKVDKKDLEAWLLRYTKDAWSPNLLNSAGK